MSVDMTPDSFAAVRGAIATRQAQLVTIRRDIHRHPEISWQEQRTTALVCDLLEEGGLKPTRLSKSGLVVDIGAEDAAYRVALRADIDALPVRERTGLDFASVSPGVCHACGHDVHTTALVGAGLALAGQDEALRAADAAVRLVFQPAEEAIPGGAELVVGEGHLEGVDAAYALHCDPSLDVGKVGLREGPITAAADRIDVKLTGRGGHTSRPHLTEDLTYALAKVVTEVPALLSRRVDPRAGALLVWGQMHAGAAGNVIPSSGEATGTLRILDAEVWHQIGPIVKELVESVAKPYGVGVEVVHSPGVPPVVNDATAIADLRAGAVQMGLDPVATRQSMGGEDFAWFLHHAPGAMARLGTRAPGGRTYDLHQGDLIVDEAAISAGAMLLASTALAAIGRYAANHATSS
ncbi:M20 family metallopeptidase [Nostocoides australiense]